MEDLFDKINRYVEGKMDPAEKQDFEAKCKHDPPHTATALKLWTDLDNMDQTVEAELNLREQLKDIHQQLYNEKSADRSRFFFTKSYWFAAASIAALLILIASILILMLPGKPAGNEELFSRYYHPEQLVAYSRSAQQPFVAAVRLFSRPIMPLQQLRSTNCLSRIPLTIASCYIQAWPKQEPVIMNMPSQPIRIY